MCSWSSGEINVVALREIGANSENTCHELFEHGQNTHHSQPEISFCHDSDVKSEWLGQFGNPGEIVVPSLPPFSQKQRIRKAQALIWQHPGSLRRLLGRV